MLIRIPYPSHARCQSSQVYDTPWFELIICKQRPDEDIVTDCNWSLVKDDEIEVGKEPPADLDMLPLVTMEWRVYECVVIGLSQDLLQFLIP